MDAGGAVAEWELWAGGGGGVQETVPEIFWVGQQSQERFRTVPDYLALFLARVTTALRENGGCPAFFVQDQRQGRALSEKSVKELAILLRQGGMLTGKIGTPNACRSLPTGESMLA